MLGRCVEFHRINDIRHRRLSGQRIRIEIRSSIISLHYVRIGRRFIFSDYATFAKRYPTGRASVVDFEPVSYSVEFDRRILSIIIARA